MLFYNTVFLRIPNSGIFHDKTEKLNRITDNFKNRENPLLINSLHLIYLSTKFSYIYIYKFFKL